MVDFVQRQVGTVSLVPPYIEALRPYEAGRTVESVRRQYGINRITKLASNENPLGSSPLAIEAIRRSLGTLNLYPDGGLALREVLANQFDVKVDNVITGSGSEGIMSNIIRAFLCDEDEVLTTEAAFIGFQVLARSRGVKYQTAPYSDWHYDLPALAERINPTYQDHLSRQPPTIPLGRFSAASSSMSSIVRCRNASSSFSTKLISSTRRITRAIPTPCTTATTT